MKLRSTWVLALLSVAALSLTACGGGGSSSTTASGTAPTFVADPGAKPLTEFLSGLDSSGGGAGGDAGGDGGAGGAAGDGGSMKNANIVLTCSDGTTKYTATTDAKGMYAIKFNVTTCTQPYLVKVIDSAGNSYASVGVETPAVNKVVTINVSPLSDKVVSDILPASIPGTAQDFKPADLLIANLPTAKDNLVTSIKTALATAGLSSTTGFDPIKSTYTFDGTGVDAVLESIVATRNPVTGATQLQAKLVSVGSGDTATASLITAANPLPAAQVNVPSNPSLNFAKLNAWVTEANRCLALAPTTVDVACDDADGTRLVSNSYKSNGYPFEADFKVLFSDPNADHIQGSEFRNPVLLFVGKYTGSAASYDDLAVVEVTIRQPRTGPETFNRNGIASSLSTPVEYTKNLIFKRDDTLTQAKAGNWILYGNQRSLDWSVEPRVFSWVQQNPAKTANTSGNSPSGVITGLQLNFNPFIFDAASSNPNKMVHNDVYAVRIKGPGLPAAGLVMTPSTNIANRFAVLNKTGTVPSAPTSAIASTQSNTNSAYASSIGLTATGLTQHEFRLSGVALDGSPLFSGFWPGPSSSNYPYHSDDPTAIDFTQLGAFNLYTAEIYRGTSSVPTIETTRTLAAVPKPTQVVGYAKTDLSPSASLVTPTLPSATSLTVAWTRVIGAPRIESGYVYATDATSRTNPSSQLSDAFTLSPTSTSVAVSGTFPAMSNSVAADFREVGVSGRQARVSMVHALRWSN